jgi:hypothetical protein
MFGGTEFSGGLKPAVHGCGEPLGDNGVDRGIEDHSNVGARRFKVHVRVTGYTVTPVHDRVRARVDRRHHDRIRQVAAEGIHEVAWTAGSIAGRQNSFTVARLDRPPNVLGRTKDVRMSALAAEGGCQRYHGSDIIRSLRAQRHGDQAAEAVPDDVDLLPRFAPGTVESVIQRALDQEIRAVVIDSDSREVWPVIHPVEPCIQFDEEGIGTEKAGYEDHSRFVSVGRSQAVIDRRYVKQRGFERRKAFPPHGKVMRRLIVQLQLCGPACGQCRHRCQHAHIKFDTF